MTVRDVLACVVVAAALVAAGAARADQSEPLEVALYAPALPFSDSTAARRYLDGLGSAIGKATGRRVTGRVYFRYADVVKARPDFAILDARCVAAHNPGEVLAVALVGGKPSQEWGVFGRDAKTVADLKGQRVARDETGCRDDEFLRHTLLYSELPTTFFGPLIAKRNAEEASKAVTDTKVARGAFLPRDAAGQLTRLFSAGTVPTPALVAIGSVDDVLAGKVGDAAVGYATKGVITGWRRSTGGVYRDLAARMTKRRKRSILVDPIDYVLRASALINLAATPSPRPSVKRLLQ